VPTPYSGAASDFVLPCSPFIRTIQITSNDDVFFYSEAIPPPSNFFVKTPSSVPLFPSPAPTIPDLIPMTTGTGESTRSIATRRRSPPPRTASSPPLSLETTLHLRAPPSHPGRYASATVGRVGDYSTFLDELRLSIGPCAGCTPAFSLPVALACELAPWQRVPLPRRSLHWVRGPCPSSGPIPSSLVAAVWPAGRPPSSLLLVCTLAKRQSLVMRFASAVAVAPAFAGAKQDRAMTRWLGARVRPAMGKTVRGRR
jgi:hypothetical protein